jgi:hypothetical protein
MNSNTKLKVVLTIILAVIFVYILQGAEPICRGLKLKYLEYNDAYFDGVLPRNTIVEYGTCPDAQSIACTTHPGDVFKITLVKEYNLAPVQAHVNLLHESCHIVTWTELEEHGPRWKDCMHRIYQKGAFEGIL